MKCAMELCTVAAIRAAELAEAEELRRQREANEKYERTIRVCEEIGQKLEELASKGEKPYYKFQVDYRGRRLVRASRSDYADRRVEHYGTGEPLDLGVMQAWFAQYCFKMSIQSNAFAYWLYGTGRWWADTVLIEPDPDCVK